MKAACAVVVLLGFISGCARSEWKIKETVIDYFGARDASSGATWEAMAVFFYLDCPSAYPESVEFRNVRVESGGNKTPLEVVCHVDSPDEGYRKKKSRRVYFIIRRDAVRWLSEAVLKATIASEGFPDIQIEYRLNESELAQQRR